MVLLPSALSITDDELDFTSHYINEDIPPVLKREPLVTILGDGSSVQVGDVVVLAQRNYYIQENWASCVMVTQVDLGPKSTPSYAEKSWFLTEAYYKRPQDEISDGPKLRRDKKEDATD